MTLQDFSNLSDERKARLLHRYGTYIGKRKLASTTIVLYQLEGFYAEVYYHQYRRIIECINCFADTVRLDPYLLQIDVEHLV